MSGPRGGPASALALCLALLAGCSSQQVQVSHDFDPRAPLRIAVLPFVDGAEGDFVVSRPLTTGLDLVPLLGPEALDKRHAATVLRSWFVTHLDATPLDAVPPLAVDSAIARHRLDVAEAYRGDRALAARRFGQLLGADAVAFGQVLAWDRSYYAVQSFMSVGLQVELRDTTTGAVLLGGRAIEREHWGLSKLPGNLAFAPLTFNPILASLALVYQALIGLTSEGFLRLADRVTRRLVTELQPERRHRHAARPPPLQFVGCSIDGPLRPGEVLRVVALGAPGARATFRIGDGPPHLMSESAPGSYEGALPVSPGHRFAGEPLTVSLESELLLTTEVRLQRPRVWTADALAEAGGAGGGAAPSE